MREPLLAGILSLLIPGIGQIYNGRIGHRHSLVSPDGLFLDRLSRNFGLGGPSDRGLVCIQLRKGQSCPRLKFLHMILLFARRPMTPGFFAFRQSPRIV